MALIAGTKCRPIKYPGANIHRLHAIDFLPALKCRPIKLCGFQQPLKPAPTPDEIIGLANSKNGSRNGSRFSLILKLWLDSKFPTGEPDECQKAAAYQRERGRLRNRAADR